MLNVQSDSDSLIRISVNGHFCFDVMFVFTDLKDLLTHTVKVVKHCRYVIKGKESILVRQIMIDLALIVLLKSNHGIALLQQA